VASGATEFAPAGISVADRVSSPGFAVLTFVDTSVVGEHGPGVKWPVAELSIHREHGGAGGFGDGRVGQHSDEPVTGTRQGLRATEVLGGSTRFFRDYGATGRRRRSGRRTGVVAVAEVRRGARGRAAGGALRPLGAGHRARDSEQLHNEFELRLRERSLAANPVVCDYTTGIPRSLAAGTRGGFVMDAVSSLSSGCGTDLSAGLGMDPAFPSLAGHA